MLSGAWVAPKEQPAGFPGVAERHSCSHAGETPNWTILSKTSWFAAKLGGTSLQFQPTQEAEKRELDFQSA